MEHGLKSAWLSKRELATLARIVEQLYAVDIEPEALADAGDKHGGAFGANLIEKLQREGLSVREAKFALQCVLYEDESPESRGEQA